MNRVARGLLTGGLLGLATAGLMMLAGNRSRRRMLQSRSRMLRHRARHTMRAVRDNAKRFGAAVKIGSAAFASRLAEKDSWGRT